MSNFTVVDPETVDQEPFPESGIFHRKFTELLGCTEMRVNSVTLAPGQATVPHTHKRQEEVYIALDGGHIEIAGTHREVPPGGIVRISPDAVRSIRNETEAEAQTWILCGAPPLGTVDDFREYAMPGDGAE